MKTRSFRPRDDAQDKAIDKFMNKKGLDKAEAMRKIVDIALDMENRYESLDSEKVCDSLAFEEKDYRCVFGRMGRTPDIKKLGTTELMKDAICSSCKKTLDMKERLFTMEQRIAKGIIVDIPSCKHGGQLTEDGKKLYCKNPHMTSQYRDVEKWCKVVRNKANCESLTWTRIAVKGKLPDGQNL